MPDFPAEYHIGEVGTPSDIVDVTLVSDTSILASGDVITDTTTVSGAVRKEAGRAILQSLVLIDEDDQGTALDLVFFKATQSLGTKNSTPNISDAASRDCLGFISIATTDFIDLGGTRIATLRGLGLVVEAAAASKDIFVSAICRSGTPTYTASGLKLKLGFLQE